jgi:hypothetical protein
MLKEYPRFHLFLALGLLLQQTAIYIHYVLASLLIQIVVSLFLVFVFAKETALAGRFHKRMVIGLTFLLAGFCCFNLRFWFNLPLNYLVICDLIAFYFLTKAFYLDFSSAPELDKTGARIAIACTALLATASYFALRPYLGKHQVIVLLMTIVLSFTLMMASFRRERVPHASFRRILIGIGLLAIYQGYLVKSIFIADTTYFESVGSAIFLVSLYFLITGGMQRKLIALPEEVK